MSGAQSPSSCTAGAMMANSPKMAAKHAARENRQQLASTKHTNHGALEALRAIEERVLGKVSGSSSLSPSSSSSSPSSPSARILSKDIHKSLEACLEQERNLYTAIPEKFCFAKNSKDSNKKGSGETHSAALAVLLAAPRSQDQKRQEEHALALILADSAEAKQQLFSEPREQSPQALQALQQSLKRKQEPPLMPRNVVPKSASNTASRYSTILKPSESRKTIVAEQKAKAAEKMMVKPGEKCPPPAHQYEFKPEEHTPLKKPADWVPAAASPEKFPARWSQQPASAQRHVSPSPLMRFNSNVPAAAALERMNSAVRSATRICAEAARSTSSAGNAKAASKSPSRAGANEGAQNNGRQSLSSPSLQHKQEKPKRDVSPSPVKPKKTEAAQATATAAQPVKAKGSRSVSAAAAADYTATRKADAAISESTTSAAAAVVVVATEVEGPAAAIASSSPAAATAAAAEREKAPVAAAVDDEVQQQQERQQEQNEERQPAAQERTKAVAAGAEEPAAALIEAAAAADTEAAPKAAAADGADAKHE